MTTGVEVQKIWLTLEILLVVGATHKDEVTDVGPSGLIEASCTLTRNFSM
jgi:hypothetical protein